MLPLLRLKKQLSVFYKRNTRFLSLKINELEEPFSNISIPFAIAKKGGFVQDVPHLENSFEGDAFLQRNLKRILPQEVSLGAELDVIKWKWFDICSLKVYNEIEGELSSFGARTATDIYR